MHRTPDTGQCAINIEIVLPAPFDREAFRWDQASGMVGLGFLPTKGANSIADSVTPDGSVIVGSSGENGDSVAFVWDVAHGMRSLQDLLNADTHLIGNLTGWNLAYASAISDDGKAIVGQKEVEGWGGRVEALSLVAGQSTTSVIDRILAGLDSKNI